MKKVICLFMIVLSLLFVPNVVFAQETGEYQNELQQVEEFPERFIRLNYESYELYREYVDTIEYLVVYTLPYRYSSEKYHHFIYLNKVGYGFVRGYNINENSTIVHNISRYSDHTVIEFRITIRKDMINSLYPDGDVTPFFETDSSMYIRDDGYYYEKAYNDGYDIGYEDGVKDGIKSITNKPITILLEWTIPFISLIILLSIYVGYKKEWFHSD